MGTEFNWERGWTRGEREREGVVYAPTVYMCIDCTLWRIVTLYKHTNNINELL